MSTRNKRKALVDANTTVGDKKAVLDMIESIERQGMLFLFVFIWM